MQKFFLKVHVRSYDTVYGLRNVLIIGEVGKFQVAWSPGRSR